jgi:hypothetical protein
MNLASKVTLQSAGVGLLVSAVQNALEKCVSGYHGRAVGGRGNATGAEMSRADRRLGMTRELWVSSPEQEGRLLSSVSYAVTQLRPAWA